MKRTTVTLLALGLAAATGVASAQTYYDSRGQGYGTYGTYGQQYGQQYGQPYPDRYGTSSGAVYDYARVVRVDPVIDSRYGGYNTGGYSSGNQRCYTRTDGYASRDPYYGDGYGGRDDYYRNDPYRNDPYRGGNTAGATVATVIGGLVGAAIGSQVGGGSARYATSALGSMVGGMAGRQVYENAQRDRYRTGTVQVCDPVPVRSGYGSYPVNDGQVAGYDVTYEYAGRSFRTRTNYHPGDRIRVRVDVRPE